MKIVGVDPGLTGAIALLDTVTQDVGVWPMPTYIRDFATARGKKARAVFDMVGAHNLLSRLRETIGATHYVVERVGGIPGQSAPAAFNFGYGAGALDAWALSMGYVIERVEPQRWKAALRVPADKKQARARASELMPTAAKFWPLVKDDGKAEAALLCTYGELLFAPLRSV